MLKFLGIGSAFNTEMGNTSAYIKEKDTLLLIDCGETTFLRLREMQLLNDVKNVYIIITHNHSDHIGSLSTLIFYLAYIKNITANLIVANDESGEQQEQLLRAFLTMQGVDEDLYDITYADMMEDVLTDLQKIELVTIKHSKSIASYAVEMYFKGKTVYYTGDNYDLKYLKKLAAKIKKNDIIYTDSSISDYKNRCHVLLTELDEIFNEDLKKQVYCMHFENVKAYNDAKNLGFNVVNRELSKEELLKKLANRK